MFCSCTKIAKFSKRIFIKVLSLQEQDYLFHFHNKLFFMCFFSSFYRIEENKPFKKNQICFLSLI